MTATIETTETTHSASYAPSSEVGGVAVDQLRSFVTRIERLNEDRKALADDISEVFAEAKGVGFDVKAMRKIIAMRSKDPDALSEEDATIELYRAALGV